MKRTLVYLGICVVGCVLAYFLASYSVHAETPPSEIDPAGEKVVAGGTTERIFEKQMNTPLDMIRLPMVQCLNREELTALMAQCWADTATIKGANTAESHAILAAAIFAVRADNIQSGKETYVREWSVTKEDQK